MSEFFETNDKLIDCCFIPVGYRCYTNIDLRKYNLITESLPFGVGFFPPQSIASILKNPNMDLLLDDKKEPKNFTFSKRTQDGKSFKIISESEIEIQLKTGDEDRLLDGEGGHYTLQTEHNFVLAHYLWHKSSDKYKTNYRNIVDIVSSMFQRRLKRLTELCESHKNKIFVYYHHQSNPSVKINNVEYDLTDMDVLKNQLNESFGENTLLCFSNFKKKNENGIFYFEHSEYKNFCKYASSKLNKK
jgi:hypothetical protein